MLDDLNSSLINIPSDALDALFNEGGSGEVTADNLVIGKTTDDEKLPQLELEDLDNLEKPKDEEVKEEEKKEEKKEEVVIPEAKKEEKKDDKKEEAETPEELATRKALYKSNVDYLVSKGLFKDFDGREDLDLDDETYAELLEAQYEAAVEERYDFKKKSAGDYGEAILDYIEKGGDPDKLIDLFKEQKAIQNFDIATEDSQKELISKYYKETIGWKSDRIKKYLDGLALEDGELEKEAGEIKGKYEQATKQQLAELRKQQEIYEQEQDRVRKEYENNLKKVIEETKEYDDNRRNLLKNGLFKYRKLENGATVNELYLKFAEWQRDPRKYVELAEFLLDHDNYIKRKEVEINNKVVEKTFKFIKGNAAVSKKSGTAHTEVEKSDEKQNTFSFKK